MNDVFGAIRAWVLTQTAITDLVSTRVFINQLPRSVIEAQDTFHPQKMLVIQMAGGAGSSDFIQLDRPNINILCYGETQLEADKVRRAVWSAFKGLSRVRVNNVLIHHINPSGGALPSVDPDIVWPILSQQFSALAATEA